MEVHHHSHPGKKKWIEYIWEFLMLFLAVFCGFLAENFREHQVEHKRELHYIRSLAEDLDADIKQIENNQKKLQLYVAQLDSVKSDFFYLKDGMPSLSSLKILNYHFGFPDFIYTDRTIQQLKNAGNMRLIRNLEVADSITNYDATVRRGMVHQDMVNNFYIPRMDNLLAITLNTDLIEKLLSGTLDYIEKESGLENILLTSDKIELIQFANQISLFAGLLQTELMFISRDKDSAVRLLTLIRKEYNL